MSKNIFSFTRWVCACLLLTFGSVVLAQTGTITTVAGNGTIDFSGDGGAALNATLHNPYGVALDRYGNIYIADHDNFRVRRVDALTGIITTVAGTGFYPSTIDGPGGDPRDDLGDNGPATGASLGGPFAITVDGHGNLFIVCVNDNRIRRVDAGIDGKVTGVGDEIITTVAGNGSMGFSGDGDFAVNASLNAPRGVALDAAGNLLIADSRNSRIRRVDAVSHIITTVVGNGADCSEDPCPSIGDGGPALNASLFPLGITVASDGSLFIPDSGNFRVRRVEPGDDGIVTGLANETITTVAGNGTSAFSGDNGLATAAGVIPSQVAVDAGGNLFVASAFQQRVLRVDAGNDSKVTGSADETITTVAGTGSIGYSGDNGPATSAHLAFPWITALDGAGNLLIADQANQRIRRVEGIAVPPAASPNVSVSVASLDFGTQLVGTPSGAQSVILTNIGTADLSISSIAASAEFGQTNDCGSLVTAGTYCTIGITFTPTTTGPRSGSLTIADNAFGSPHNVSLNGAGIAPLSLKPLAKSLNFAKQPIGTLSPQFAVDVQNPNTLEVEVAGVAASGDFIVQSNSCGTSVAPGADCTLGVSFSPAATGDQTGNLTIASYAAGSPQTVSLSGKGTFLLSPSPTSVPFAKQAVGTTSPPQIIFLVNPNGAPATITSLSTKGPFAVAGGTTCGGVLVGLSTCSIAITFTPTAKGPATGTLVILDDAENSPQKVGLSGSGK